MRLLSCLWAVLICVAMLIALPACGDDSDDGPAAGAGGSGDGDGDGDGDDEELPEVDCDTADVPVFADVSAFDKCVMCHSSEKTGSARRNAPAAVNFDVYESAVEHAEHAAEEVFEGKMPLPSSGITITAAEKEALYAWALCGTPED